MLTIKTAGFEEYLNQSGGGWIKCLILGEYGVGKTPSAARWPDPIIADCERGVMSVARLGTPYATIETSKDMEDLLEHLRRDSLQPAEKRKYRTVIIDTIDSYQRLLTTERLKAERKEALSGWADWGWLGGKMSQLIEKLLNLPINVVVNMHVKDQTDDDGDSSILVKKSALKGEIGDSIYRDFDLIGLMEKSYVSEDGERVLKRQIRWHSEPKFPMLRDRSGNLPRFTDVDFTSDDYTRIFEAITAGVDDLPQSTTLETVEDEDAEVQPAAPDKPGGPVGNVKLPKNPPAKKAAAKKAAKKAEPKPAPDEPVVEEQGTPIDEAKDYPPEDVTGEPFKEPTEDPWKSADQGGGQVAQGEEPENSTGTDVPAAESDETDAQALLEAELGATEIQDEPQGPGEPAAKKATATPVAKATQNCGDVPAGLAGDPSLGCGKELTPQNAMKRAMAQLRTKTLLCDDCFETWKSNN